MITLILAKKQNKNDPQLNMIDLWWGNTPEHYCSMDHILVIITTQKKKMIVDELTNFLENGPTKEQLTRSNLIWVVLK